MTLLFYRQRILGAHQVRYPIISMNQPFKTILISIIVNSVEITLRYHIGLAHIIQLIISLILTDVDSLPQSITNFTFFCVVLAK